MYTYVWDVFIRTGKFNGFYVGINPSGAELFARNIQSELT